MISTGVIVNFDCLTACTAEITHRGLATHTISNGRIDIVVRVDGSDKFAELGYRSGWFANFSGFGYVNLAAGPHTAEVFFACSKDTPGGTCTYYGDNSGIWDHLYVSITAAP